MTPQLADGTIVAINGGWVQIWNSGAIVEQQFFANAADVVRFAVDCAKRVGVRPVIVLHPADEEFAPGLIWLTADPAGHA